MCLYPFRNYKFHQIPHFYCVHCSSVPIHHCVSPLQKRVPDSSHSYRPSNSLPATTPSDYMSAAVFDSLPIALSPSPSSSSHGIEGSSRYGSPRPRGEACGVSHSTCVQGIQLSLLSYLLVIFL
uniref:Uncharacterized protein n=1 Tax=Cucumis melo TaxID=3656 RepID=A0A9I9E5I9_CUCME